MSLHQLRAQPWAGLCVAALAALGCGGGSSAPGTAEQPGVDGGGDACDPTVQACGACDSDAQCPAGAICDATEHLCVPGCTTAHGCPGGKGCCAGACVDVKSDAKHCGACGVACAAAAHAAGTCIAGKCALSCDKGFGDCNGLPSDGCEASTSDDPKRCGGCDKACSNANIAQPVCASGMCVGACNPGFQDCDGDKLKNGCESSVTGDPANCGGCGQACSSQHLSSKSCVDGECTGSCDPGWGDCNGTKQADGCETGFETDPKNCGACSIVCSSNHVPSPSCTMGVCSGACEAGWSDCNGNLLTDGCEVPTATDLNNCGGCGAKCSSNHLQAISCSAGTCDGSCASGYADCNGNKQSDGCEVSLQNDPFHCGGCGVVCSANHVALSCQAGACAGACEYGWTDCDGNKQTNGCEVHTAADTSNCGGCGASCSLNHVSATCVAGSCSGSCDPGFLDCNGNKQYDGCETSVLSDVTSCGGCGVVCSSNHIAVQCTSGVCDGACAPGWVDCNGNKQADGCEVFPASDPLNCGACGLSCSSNHVSASCSSGACTGTCHAGYADCDGNLQGNGCETYVSGSTANCGACGVICSTNHVAALCSAGICSGACQAGWADCDGNKQANGCETNIATSVATCGGCSVACSTNHITASCLNGLCNGICEAGWGDCNNAKQPDGCETELASSVTSCGACGKVCSSNHVAPSCHAGVCDGACAAGWTDCDGNKQTNGCEANLALDPWNCGGCGTVCSTSHVPTPSCGAGVCTGACAAGWSDCDGNKQSNGCETSTATDPNNCGVCGKVCGAGQQCVNGGCLTCNSAVLVLGDNDTVASEALVSSLNSHGLVATLVPTGLTSYAGTPAASGFGAVIIPVAQYGYEMPAAGQSAIVAANTAGTGVVFTEWAGYNYGLTIWATLKPLIIFDYSSSAGSSLVTYTLTAAGHPLWTGLPTTFGTVNSTYSATGTVINGGVSIASANPPGGPGVIVRDGKGRIVAFSHAAHAGMAGTSPWGNDVNIAKLMANAGRWAARCL